jgi:hypothetical protein
MTVSAESLSARSLARFTLIVAFAAIFIDAAIGHGLTWENDPYWTYWITKTFLIATVFGLGTAWLGIGVGRGAIISAIHTLVLTIYYWTFSPIGLPSHPTWLDLEHTWITGLPIHFGVIYVGYLIALWVWRRDPSSVDRLVDARDVAWQSLVWGLVIVVVAGGLASLAVGDFPGVTWYLVRLLITVTFLLGWWSHFGRDALSGLIGATLLALVWATYGHFLGPSGLPDRPLRILDAGPPPAAVEWLGYRDLWLISLPVYLAVMIVVFAVASRRSETIAGVPFGLTALVPVAILILALIFTDDTEGVRATFSATGDVDVAEVGAGSGDIQIDAVDMGNRVSPLPPHDQLSIDAAFSSGGRQYAVTVRQAMIEDPLGEESTWWGVAFDADYREDDENFATELVAYGLGDVTVDGSQIAAGIPVEVIASEDTEYGMTLEVGTETSRMPGVESGVLVAQWRDFSGHAPHSARTWRYLGGGIVLLGMIAAGLAINRRDPIVDGRQVPAPGV